VPSFIVSGNDTVTAPIVPDGAATVIQVPSPEGPGNFHVGSINENSHPLLIDYLKINSQPIPAICDIDTLDVQPSPSILGPSLIDLAVSWLERNPGSQYTPSYFIVRYGPIVRTLVEDGRRPHKIIPGLETIVRTGTPSMNAPFLQGQPERQIRVMGVPKASLISFQVCAIYDPNIEHLISWDVVQSQHVDLIALQSSSDPNVQIGQLPKGSITSLAPLATDESPLSATPADESSLPSSNIDLMPASDDQNGDGSMTSDQGDADQTVPIVVQVGLIDSGRSVATFWLMVIGGILLALVTAIAAYTLILRLFSKRGLDEKKSKIASFPTVPIAVITKAQVLPQSQKEKEALEQKEPEKIALP